MVLSVRLSTSNRALQSFTVIYSQANAKCISIANPMIIDIYKNNLSIYFAQRKTI